MSCIGIDTRCTGCNLCQRICSQGAIINAINTEGFWYPQVDKDKCIECGQCLRYCPVYGENISESYSTPTIYAGWNNNEIERKFSSSGGIFILVAKQIISSNGSVYGAAYSEDFSIKHIRVTKDDELKKIQGSKYVQSYIDAEIYNQIERDLLNGRLVLFSGTPCQTHAASNLFNKYPNFYSVDVICHGVPSPKAWKKYLEEISINDKILAVNMRYKDNGWNKFHFLVELENGENINEYFNDSTWGKSFISNLFLRESCYDCGFKKEIRQSDLSLGDFWEAARGEHKELDDNDKGTSVVFVNSEKGKYLIKNIEWTSQQIPFEWVPDKTYAVIKSSPRNTNREKALAVLDTMSFNEIVEKFTAPSILRRIKNRLKSFGIRR